MKTIPIFFTFDRNYVLAACVALFSLLRHASRQYHYVLYVVHTDLLPADCERIRNAIASFTHAELIFKDASGYTVAWERMSNKSHFSKEIFYKLTAAEMFPEYDRILFSDVDVIFTADISESYFMFPDEAFYYAGTRPIQENPGLPRYRSAFTEQEIELIATYEISAGYMLINLKQLREDRKQEQLTTFFHENVHRLILPEQDCIALCCTEGIRFLPYKYVVCAFQTLLDGRQVTYNPYAFPSGNRDEEIAAWEEMIQDMVQLHYPGANKPWNSPFVPRYGAWLKECVQAGLFGWYLYLQPRFLKQRLQRYSLKRFVGKMKKKIYG